MGRALLIAMLVCVGCDDKARPDRAASPRTSTVAVTDALLAPDLPEGRAVAPRLTASAATATFDAATRTLRLPGLNGIEVHDGSGALVHLAPTAELAAIHANAMAKRTDPTIETIVSITATTTDGHSHASAHQLETLRYDAATATTELVLRASTALAGLPPTLTRPALVMGPVPLHIVCCSCDWACVAGWAFGYCSTCLSSTVGASSCCAVCGIPANSSQTCP